MLLIRAVLSFSISHIINAHIRIPLIREKLDGLIRLPVPRDYWDFIFSSESQESEESTQPLYKLPITNYLNVQYSARIGLGTPPQEFRVLLDTGSADLWVFSSKCSFFSKSCRKHRRYDSSLSSTYQANGKEVALNYLKGSIDGFISNDVLRIAGLSVLDQCFIEVTGEGDKTFEYTEFDGILGLGFQSLSRTKENIPVLNMASQGLIQPLFSFLLNSNDEDESGGELILGGWDESKFLPETLNTIPVIRPVYWQIPLEGVGLEGSDNVMCALCSAVLDTGSSLIMGPVKQVEGLLRQLSVPVSFDNGLAQVDCSDVTTLPDIKFYINGQNYPISPQHYILRDDSGLLEVCAVGLGALSEEQKDLWILGDVFLRRYYSIYNLQNKTVSLAHLT